MSNQKLITLIGFVLVFFVLIKVLTVNLCDPMKNTVIGSVIENSIPKISNESLDELRRIWLTLSSKFCPSPPIHKL